MMRVTLCLSIILLVSMAARPQTLPAPAPPPQTARQALLEMFLGETPDHMERHLPEVAKKAFRQISASGNDNFLAQISMMSAQARMGGLQPMEAGPILLLSEEPAQREKFEVVVERDSLMGDEDQIELTFHIYKNGKEERLPVLPRLTFDMVLQANVWRLNEINFSARMPLGDADFIKGFVTDMVDKQKTQNEMRGVYHVRSIAKIESAYHAAHPDRSYICSLPDLGQAAQDLNPEGQKSSVIDGLASGSSSGYVFALTGCTNARFQVVAEPATPESGKQAFCADESGRVRAAKDGKAVTCLTRGEDQGPDTGFMPY